MRLSADRELAPAGGRPAGLEVGLFDPADRAVAVGGGTALFVHGTCRHPSLPIERLDLILGSEVHGAAVYGLELREPDSFWGIVPIAADRAGMPSTLAVRAVLAGGEVVVEPVADLELRTARERIGPHARSLPAGSAALVAICMATYEPSPELFRRQIESIRSQTHRRWICLVSDDGSSEASFEHLRGAIGDDPRFVLRRGPVRVGAYRNFERALRMAPAEATHVALADQDDVWHPEKLAKLLDALGSANLAYSDMQIVSPTGEVRSPTFWRGRRNNHTNLASLLLANTVTGAASLFRRELLELVLPFPPPTPDAFHDQWIAAAALATGEIAYVDRPLHDYVQHADASLGHAASVRGYRPLRLIDTRSPRTSLAATIAHARRSSLLNVARIASLATTLELRCGPALSAPKRPAVRRLARLADPPEPAAWLALRSLRRFAGRNETVGMELVVLNSILWRRLAMARARRRIRRQPD